MSADDPGMLSVWSRLSRATALALSVVSVLSMVTLWSIVGVVFGGAMLALLWMGDTVDLTYLKE